MRKTLGKGLNALLPEDKDDTITEIQVELIKPDTEQPRKYFDSKSLQNLADSIRQYGILQPVVLNKINETYRIIAGERRYRAAIMAGLKKVPAVIKEFEQKDVELIALIENLQREDLNPIEEAKAFEKLAKNYNYTHEDIAKNLSKSRSFVTNSMRLLQLDEHTKDELFSGNITPTFARSLLSVDSQKRPALIEDYKNAKIIVRDVEKIEKKHRKKKERDIFLEDFANNLSRSSEFKVTIDRRKRGFRVNIDCINEQELEKLGELLGYEIPKS